MTHGLRVGDVARETGVSRSTIRHYERLGLLPRAHRTNAGYRMYPPGAIDRVRLVRSGVQFGFTLKQLAAFLGIRDGGGAPCRDVRAAGQRVLDAADQELETLKAARDEIARTLREWDRRLAGTQADRPAHLLEALPNTLPERTIARRRYDH